MLRRVHTTLILCGMLSCWAPCVFADAGDVHLALVVGAESPRAARTGVSLFVGISDWWAFEGGVVGVWNGISVDVARVQAALAWSFDVLRWVPEVSVGGGVERNRGGWSPVLSTALGVRHYLSMAWWLGGRLGLDVVFEDALVLHPNVGLAVGFEVD